MTDDPRLGVGPRWWRSHGWDVVGGVVAVALSLRVLADSGAGPGFRAPDLLAYLVTGVGAAAIVWARSRPLTALIIAGSSATLAAWRDYHVDVLPFVVAVVLFMVGNYLPRRPAIVGLVVGALGLAATAFSRPADLPLSGAIQSMAIFAGAWVLGRVTRSRRGVLLALVSAAEQRAAAERELAAGERARASVAQVEERLRIARELHDVLAHSISVISVQATVGEHLAGADPSAARQALTTIGEASRSSMQELRQMLSLLRDDSVPSSERSVSYEPAQGLGDLEPLLDTYRSTGLQVATTTQGEHRNLSPSADLCAYRIIQEALTNTMKHAGPSSAVVGLCYGSDALRVTISDDGHSSVVTGGGHGLVGMRERAALLGGELSAGPMAAGGFRVQASIPYESHR